MRPIDKGSSPYVKINNYQDAEPYLNDRIGRYCSFCELPIFHVPEVEHREGKKSGGDLTKWENLLYGCKYCNTRKSQKIKVGKAKKWLWPDKDNTFLAYTYYGGDPKINESYLKSISLEVYEKAQALYEGVGLGFSPKNITDRDKRWMKRLETLGVAEDSRRTWLKMKASEFKEDELRQIITLAKQMGFFSIWMLVFFDDSEVKNALINAFPGTSKTCFDENGDAVKEWTDSETL